MINLTQIVMLLQVALSFLHSAAGTPMQPQAIQIATNAIHIAQIALVQSYANPIPSTYQEVIVGQIIPTNTQPIQNTMTTTLEIISPEPIRGIGKRIDPITGVDLGYRANDYKTNPDGTLAEGSISPDESNFIYLGVIVYVDNNPVNNATVSIESPDSSQNKTMTNTGNITRADLSYSPYNIPVSVPFYPFRYQFKTTGTNTIKFTANGVSQSVKLEVH